MTKHKSKDNEKREEQRREKKKNTQPISALESVDCKLGMASLQIFTSVISLFF